MLDYFAIFTKGGALLWAWQLSALRGDPVGALVRSCLLEDRAGEKAYTYSPPGAGGACIVKWSFHNALQLVVVAVHAKALSLLYVDQLLEDVKQAFVVKHYQPHLYEYPKFDATFRRMLADAEAAAAVARRPTAQPKPVTANGVAGSKTRHKPGAGARQSSGSEDDEDDSSSGEAGKDAGKDAAAATAASKLAHMAIKDGAPSSGTETPDGNSSGAEDGHAEHGGTAFDTSVLGKRLGKRRPGLGRGGAKAPEPASAKGSPSKDDKKPKKKEARTWDDGTNSKAKAKDLDFSAEPGATVESSAKALDLGRSLVDAADDASSEDESEGELADGAGGAAGAGARGGFLSTFVRSLGVSVVGTSSLTAEDIAPALDALRRKLMERNVASEIADKVVDSVRGGLEGQALGSLTRVSTVVRSAVEAALTRILTPKRSIDILREVRAAQAAGRPYTIVFVGVNGVGKSTNLAKIAYWLLQNDVKVLIAACDTFRSGAVEQLKTHCARLGVPLYEKGYEKDPARVAGEAIKQAARTGADVVLVDTAGRMQDNEPLMRALSSLIVTNDPDLVLFVGEALVGNDAVDQLSKFKSRLADLAAGPGEPHTVDGIVLTKMDAIDDKVGAALSMVYTGGAPIMFCGVGQTYVDLRRLNVKSVVHSLLK